MRLGRFGSATFLIALSTSTSLFAQDKTKTEDKPSISIGATLFTDYTFVQSPAATDSDSNTYHPSGFNLTRSYINVTGKASRLIAFRITPDIARDAGTGSSLNGSLIFRLKYAFAQFNLDDYTGKGSWARVGIQQTPLIDFQESVYRYRFQGPVFADREGYLSSSDMGISYHANIPRNYGDFHVGYYNGENYNRPEANDQKSVQVRGTVRPLPNISALKGLRVTGFYNRDHYVRNAERKRLVTSVTFEHQRFNAGAEWLATQDQISVKKLSVDGKGYSLWATPKLCQGWEGLLRYDHFIPNTIVDHERNRTILGLAYWFPRVGSVSSALLLDYDGQTFQGAAVPVRKIAVHALVSF